MNVRLDTYQPVFFDLKAKVLINRRYQWSDVKAAIEAVLVESFSFAQREFAKAVSLAEVISAIQSVSGVISVDLDELHRFDETGSPLPADGVLRAGLVQWPDGEVAPTALAELLLINPLGIELNRMAEEEAQ